jgi:hypothetical protein
VKERNIATARSREKLLLARLAVAGRGAVPLEHPVSG